jgi:hypothetical protein
MSRFPKPYVGDVKKDDSTMVYVPMDKMDIGSRNSGLPENNVNGAKSLEHVGGTTGSGMSKGKK